MKTSCHGSNSYCWPVIFFVKNLILSSKMLYLYRHLWYTPCLIKAWIIQYYHCHCHCHVVIVMLGIMLAMIFLHLLSTASFVKHTFFKDILKCTYKNTLGSQPVTVKRLTKRSIIVDKSIIACRSYTMGFWRAKPHHMQLFKLYKTI